MTASEFARALETKGIRFTHHMSQVVRYGYTSRTGEYTPPPLVEGMDGDWFTLHSWVYYRKSALKKVIAYARQKPARTAAKTAKARTPENVNLPAGTWVRSEELERLTGVSRTTLYNYRFGERKPGYEQYPPRMKPGIHWIEVRRKIYYRLPEAKDLVDRLMASDS